MFPTWGGVVVSVTDQWVGQVSVMDFDLCGEIISCWYTLVSNSTQLHEERSADKNRVGLLTYCKVRKCVRVCDTEADRDWVLNKGTVSVQ